MGNGDRDTGQCVGWEFMMTDKMPKHEKLANKFATMTTFKTGNVFDKEFENEYLFICCLLDREYSIKIRRHWREYLKRSKANESR